MMHSRLIFILTLLLAAYGLSGCKKENTNTDKPPIASLTILGTAITNNTFVTRSGSDVLVSAKDSEGVDDPILTYEFTAISVNNTDLELANINTSLLERTRNTKAFKTPKVDKETVIEFQLTVSDSDQVERSTTATLVILPTQDADVFLTQKAVNDPEHNTYLLAVALDLAEAEISASNYSVLIENFAEWSPAFPHTDCQYGASNNLCRRLMSSEIVSGEWQAGLTFEQVNAETAANAYFNPRHRIDMPFIDVDEINRHYDIGAACETNELRCMRLELDKIDQAQTVQQFSFVSASSHARLLILEKDSEQYVDSGLLWLSTRSDDSTQNVDVDLIRRSQNVESFASANAYYRMIDPLDQATTLTDWLNHRGFVAGVESEPNFAHATYVNNYDLGFGRDMVMRKDDCGNVYSYVDNYPTLELALQHRNSFATVVMEYSSSNTALTCNQQDAKFVKFYAYVPSDFTGEMVRASSMNFDGRGEKYMPGVCTVCHGGTPYNTNNAMNPASVVEFVSTLADDANIIAAVDALDSERVATMANLNATFMPFDLNAFLYAEEDDLNLTDPYLNSSLLTNIDTASYSKENQLGAFRQFNKNVLSTYLDARNNETETNNETEIDNNEGDESSRWDAPINLVNSWYNTSIDNLEQLDTIDTQNFHGDAVLPGWENQTAIYHDVFAKYCRACHIQTDQTRVNFATAEEFLGEIDIETGLPANFSKVVEQVLSRGQMPAARLTYDRFWADFNGNTASAGEQLVDVLTQYDPDLAQIPLTSTVSIDAVIQDNNNKPSANLDGSANGTDQQIRVLASGLIDTGFEWELTNDCGEDTFLHGAKTTAASFVTATSPCQHRISLAINGEEQDTQTILVDRKPVTRELTYTTNLGPNDTAEAVANYVPGDGTLTLDLLANPLFSDADFGDGSVQVVINHGAEPFGLTINNAVQLDANGHAQVLLGNRVPAEATEIRFQYQLQDLSPNDQPSIAEATGLVTIQVAPISLEINTDTLSDSSVGFSWASNPEGLAAETINIYRMTGNQAAALEAAVDAGTATPLATLTNCHVNNANVCTGGFSATSYTDTSVSAGNSYTYVVAAVLTTEPDNNNAASIRTPALVEAVVTQPVLALTPQSNAPTEMNLSWSAPSGLETGTYTLLRCNRSNGASCEPSDVLFSASCAQSVNCNANNWNLDDSGLIANNRYAYRIDVTSGITHSASSVEDAATYPAPANAVSVGSASSTGVSFSWASNGNNTTGLSYRISEVSDTGNCFSGPLTINGNLTSTTANFSCPDNVQLQIQARGLDGQNASASTFASARRLVTKTDVENEADIVASVCNDCHTAAVAKTRLDSFAADCSLDGSNTITGCTVATETFMNGQTLTNNSFTQYFKRWLDGD